MMVSGHHLPTAHYVVYFQGSDFHRHSAEAWCHHGVQRGFYVDLNDDEIEFHFQTSLDAMNFRNQFHRQCGAPKSSRSPFPW